MRQFATERNFIRAAGLSALVAAMSAPRLAYEGKPLDVYLTVLFLTMAFVCGTVTAWSRYAGMAGIVTDRRTFTRGVAVAAGLALAALPVSVFWLDPILCDALAHARGGAHLETSYPSTTGGRVALLLWSAGFQAMFLVAAPMALFARLTGSRLAAACLCLVFRCYVMHQQMAATGVTDAVLFFHLSALASAAAGCFIFSAYGLGPLVVFAAGMNLHLFTGPPCGG